MGSGGMGAFFGANLWAAGHEVHFIARGSHLHAIRDNGLRLNGSRGNIHVTSASATADPSEIGHVDAILFCVKLYDAETAAAVLEPMLGRDTLIIPVLNGVDGHDRISRVTGTGPVVGGTAYAAASIAAPGIVNYTSDMAELVIGELAGGSSDRVNSFSQAVDGAGFSCRVSDNILGVLWEKFTLLATNAGLTSVCQQPISEIYQEPERVRLARNLMTEIVAVARAGNIQVDPDIVEKCIARSKGFPPDMYSSMYFDRVQGRPMELDGLSGQVVRAGIELGVPTPCHQTIYALLKPYINGAGS